MRWPTFCAPADPRSHSTTWAFFICRRKIPAMLSTTLKKRCDWSPTMKLRSAIWTRFRQCFLPRQYFTCPAFRSEPANSASEHQQDLIHQTLVADRRLSGSEGSSDVSAGLTRYPFQLDVSVKAPHLQRDEIPEQPGPTSRAEKSHQEAALPVIADNKTFPLSTAKDADHGIHGQQNIVIQSLSRSLVVAGFAGLIFATGFLALRSRKSSTSTTTKLNQ